MGSDAKYQSILELERSAALSAQLAKVMTNVFLWMALGLVMTALTAMYVAETPALIEPIIHHRWLMFGLLFGELILVVILTLVIHSISFITAGVLFALYAILNGVTLSVIFLVYTEESIASTFFVTAGTFAMMALLGFITKHNLSGLGRILMMLLVGLIMATLASLIFANSHLTLICNYVGVVIFVGLTAYDTQKIKKMVQDSMLTDDADTTNKLALLGSLSLYLDFVNLFLYLLNIFGKKK